MATAAVREKHLRMSRWVGDGGGGVGWVRTGAATTGILLGRGASRHTSGDVRAGLDGRFHGPALSKMAQIVGFMALRLVISGGHRSNNPSWQRPICVAD